MYIVFFILGLIFGSFIGATTWRLHKYRKSPRKILQGRSICESCNNHLGPLDLVPILSYIFLRGKCRYCGHEIGLFTLFIELFTGIVFLINYIYWPFGFSILGYLYLSLWLFLIVGFLILALYDIRWKTLPSSVIYISSIFSILGLLIYLISSRDYSILISRIWGILIGGGIFWVIYQVSEGKWIGGGDVRLGFLLGFIVGGPINSILMLMIASFSALLVAIPQLLTSKLGAKSQIPFGPFLILGCVIVFLFSPSIHAFLVERYLIP